MIDQVNGDTEIEINERDPAAHYMIKSSMMFNDFPFKEVYMDVFKAIQPHLREGKSSRHIAMALLSVSFDLVTCTVAITDYASEEFNPNKLTPEADLGNFMASFIGMMNDAEEAIKNNGNLLVEKQSVYNTDEGLN